MADPIRSAISGQAGGVVFFDKGSYTEGWRYLEAAPSEEEWPLVEWGKRGTAVGGTGTAIGTGAANTAAILSKLNEDPAESYRAAHVCDLLDCGGYTDWFLPSADELQQLFEHRAILGGLGEVCYWSSSELVGAESDLAWLLDTSDGQLYYYFKDSAYAVRPIRAF